LCDFGAPYQLKLNKLKVIRGCWT